MKLCHAILTYLPKCSVWQYESDALQHTLWHAFRQTLWHTSWFTLWHVLSDMISWIPSHWHILSHTVSLTCSLKHVVCDTLSLTQSLGHNLSDMFSLTRSLWDILSDTLSLTCSHCCVSNGSGHSLWVWVCIPTEPLSNWLSGLSMNQNHQLRYSSMAYFQPVRTGRDVSGSPCSTIHRFIWGLCFCSLKIVSY